MQTQLAERIVAPNACAALGHAAARHGLGARLLCVGDDTTLHAASEAVIGTKLSLGAVVKPDIACVDRVLEAASGMTGLVAIGGGTVNDITKLAAHRLNLPYMCVATAASMNGFSASAASLRVDGHKQSLPAAPPRAVIADISIIARAPRRLARAGLGDTLCRSTVLADAYLSHLVLGTSFERDYFERMRAHETWLITNASLLREGATDFMTRLVHALLDAGDAMAQTGSSAVASQGEHMIAHTLEMMYGSEMHNVLHGELIAVTTTTMARLQHKILLGTATLRALPRDRSIFERYFGTRRAESLAQTYARKCIGEDALADKQTAFAQHWAELQHQLPTLIAPFQNLSRAFSEFGLATSASSFGIEESRYDAAVSNAYLTRDRFTFLDLAAMNARRA